MYVSPSCTLNTEFQKILGGQHTHDDCHPLSYQELPAPFKGFFSCGRTPMSLPTIFYVDIEYMQ